MSKCSCNGSWKESSNVCNVEAWPRKKVAVLDSAKKSSRCRTETTTMHILDQLCLRLVPGDNSKSLVADGSFNWDVPESIVEVPVPLHYNSRIFDDLNLVLIQDGNTVVITKLSKGDKRSTVEVVKDMSVGCRRC